MKIGIIGAGNVGGTLGARWAQGGHDVVFGSRKPQSAEMTSLVAKAGPSARSATTSEAVKASDILLLATPWRVTQDVLSATGDVSGKVLIDATNPVLPDLSGLEFGTTTSGAEMVARWASGAKVVKAFNTIGVNVMANPRFGGEPATLFYCGDDPGAKQPVRQLAAELGFEPLDAGPLTQARVLEPLALLWISLAIAHGYGFEIAFKLLRR
jgi:8-hydroxy-5-deazaflavin:NADPH oxidoreductase